ncbi:MAG: hypothetical protein R2941_00675 [Desulfobacterales bacterium]
MADNTKQFDWIVKIKEGREVLFADRVDVFVAGDLLWYPVEGDNKTRIAPASGRPKAIAVPTVSGRRTVLCIRWCLKSCSGQHEKGDGEKTGGL